MCTNCVLQEHPALCFLSVEIQPLAACRTDPGATLAMAAFSTTAPSLDPDDDRPSHRRSPLLTTMLPQCRCHSSPLIVRKLIWKLLVLPAQPAAGFGQKRLLLPPNALLRAPLECVHSQLRQPLHDLRALECDPPSPLPLQFLQFPWRMRQQPPPPRVAPVQQSAPAPPSLRPHSRRDSSRKPTSRALRRWTNLDARVSTFVELLLMTAPLRFQPTNHLQRLEGATDALVVLWQTSSS
mmetsp:Transcript_15943/g.52221  ORF Transcript_15943/g.52221 Transcript_15943/m.52221 type:complete len:238 (-) Transcript_15943:313-1026(-)